MMLKKYEEALSEFEFVINSKPDYALAFDYAAHCSFILGDRTKGIRYAKEARKRGEEAHIPHGEMGSIESGVNTHLV